MNVRLPGRCIVCGVEVVWTGRMWRNVPPRGRAPHVCLEYRTELRPTCNRWMPHARERCARAPGHQTECRTRYAMDNALRMATGRRAA